MPNPSLSLPVTRRFLAVVSAAVVAAACGSGTAPAASVGGGSPGASPAPSRSGPAPASDSTTGAIDHRTGATDVVLRLERGGGFVPIDFLASQAPSFSLYGNGVIVFQQTVTTFPEPDASGLVKNVPWRTATLDEGQIQELLAFAIGPGGLGSARDAYVAGGIADAPDTIFTLRAGGLDKTVVVSALSEAAEPGPDSAARAAFLKLSRRLLDFDAGGTIPSDVFVPDRYRGVLTEREALPGISPAAWPWPTLKPADFKEGDGSNGGPALPHRTMTIDEVAALKLTGIEGGLQGLALKGPDGKAYTLILRPLLGEEQE